MSSDTRFTPEETKAIAEKTTKWNLSAVRLGFFGFLILEIVWRTTGYPGWISNNGQDPNLWWQLTYTACIAFFVFCWTSAFHETVHQTLSSHNNFNKHLGRVIGSVVFIPYTAYRETHIRHHAYLNRPEDWELWPYSDPNRGRGFRRLFAMVDLLLGLVGAMIVYGRIYWCKNSPISSQSRRQIRNEYIYAVGLWIALASWLTLSANWLNFLEVWLLPAMIGGSIQNLRKFTEHLGMASYDPLLGTRTVRGTNWITRLSSFLNFDIFIHGPHHRHPRVAHTSLGKMMDDYVVSNPDRDFPVYGTYLQASLAMLPWLVRNPGVGMNVGAAAPATAKAFDIRDFVQDVSREVLENEDVSIG
ncbi:MAG: fatty acid desaturase [Planctomycetaceae bacterium]|nr:fatty acid desaturase [Planctomycetaceae bacterium]